MAQPRRIVFTKSKTPGFRPVSGSGAEPVEPEAVSIVGAGEGSAPAPANSESGPSEEELGELEANRQTRMAQMVGEAKQKKQEAGDQRKQDKQEAMAKYLEATRAYKLARRHYNRYRSPLVRLFLIARLPIRWILRVVAVVAAIVCVYVVSQKAMDNLADQEPPSGWASPARALRHAVAGRVAAAPEASRDHLGWALWSQREQELAAARAERQALQEQFQSTTNQLQAAQKKVEELTSRLAEQEQAIAAAREQQNQARTELAQARTELAQARAETAKLQTEKQEVEKNVAGKDASLQKALDNQKKLIQALEEMKARNAKLTEEVKTLSPPPKHGGK